KNFNLLPLGKLCNGIFLPLHWIQLNKRGNSNLEDRKTVMQELMNQLVSFGKTIRGSILLGDREFIGKDWFAYLLSEKISFVIRLREKMYFELQTYTGKKNFAQVITQICGATGNLRCAYVFRRTGIYFCNH
ncbi:MAG: transposase, partial [Bacteroidota bacterium]